MSFAVSQVSCYNLGKFSSEGKTGDRAATGLEAILNEEWSKDMKVHRRGGEEHGFIFKGWLSGGRLLCLELLLGAELDK